MKEFHKTNIEYFKFLSSFKTILKEESNFIKYRNWIINYINFLNSKTGTFKKRDIICDFIRKGNHCPYGSRCYFSHEVSKKLCKFFINGQPCKHGKFCQYNHSEDDLPNYKRNLSSLYKVRTETNEMEESQKKLSKIKEKIY